MIRNTSLALLFGMSLSACASSQTAKNPASFNQFNAFTTAQTITGNGQTRTEGPQITLEQIMSHPDWLGRQPESFYWSADSASVLFTRKQAGNELRDMFRYTLADKATQEVPLSDYFQYAVQSEVFNTDKSRRAFVYQGDIYWQDMRSGQITQLTRSSVTESSPQFLTNGDMAYLADKRVYRVNLASGLSHEIAAFELSDAPSKPKGPESYIAKEQHKLIKFAAITQKNAEDKRVRKDDIDTANQTHIAAKPFYLGPNQRIVEASLSPAGDKIIIALSKKLTFRSSSDIMPNYVDLQGTITPEKVRERVADAKPEKHRLLLLDLQTQAQHELSFDTLEGINEDVLANVKAENAQRDGETYKSEPQTRHIHVKQDWYWSGSAFQWNATGKQLAIRLEAWDNKDDWIATVNFDDHALVSEVRFHDDAWVNYKNTEFGWLTNDTLWYLSEASGFSHLYRKSLGKTAKQLTSGRYEVTQPQYLAASEQFIFRANKQHPGQYDVYSADANTGEVTQRSFLGGEVAFAISPDEKTLALRQSTLTRPPELFVQPLNSQQATRVTNTVSEKYQSYSWITPDIVPIKSSHVAQPIFTKVYLPKDYKQGEKRKGIIFNHGAGYTQDVHMGWSYYFRESMFHSMLAQQGYVVMSMDYRASMGYGRDWRTAIYRHMGKPEIEDLVDGVNWMVENANVDPNKIGTYGGSYGGFMTFMALFTQPDVFKAGAAIRPVTDWAHYNHGYTSNILNIPSVDSIAYERSSPIYFAEGLQGHLLINAPMVDDNVFFQDVVRLVQRMIELEKENFETAIYPVEPHGFKQPSSWLDEYRRIYKLFETQL